MAIQFQGLFIAFRLLVAGRCFQRSQPVPRKGVAGILFQHGFKVLGGFLAVLLIAQQDAQAEMGIRIIRVAPEDLLEGGLAMGEMGGIVTARVQQGDAEVDAPGIQSGASRTTCSNIGIASM